MLNAITTQEISISSKNGIFVIPEGTVITVDTRTDSVTLDDLQFSIFSDEYTVLN